MKPRTTLILAAILIVLVGIAALFENAKKKSRAPSGQPLFSEYDPAKADGIVITERDPASAEVKTVDLRKRGEDWVVATEGWHEADPKHPKEILEAVDKFSTTSVISNSPEKHATFQVDSAATEVRISQGPKVVADFLVGKAGPDFMSTYIRPVREQKVYLVPSYLPTMVSRGGESWRKTLLVDIDQANITGYTTRGAHGSVTVEKAADGSWDITDPVKAKAKPDILTMVLRSLSQVRSTGFADTTLSLAAMGLDADTAGVIIRTADGSSYNIQIGSSNTQNQSYTKLADQPTVYLVPRGRWNTVFRPVDTLQAPEAVGEAQP